jgi:serine/threonine protein kinase
MGIDNLKDIWPEWKIVEEIGSGSFGTVYKAERQELGVTSQAAIKVITIPLHESELRSLRADGLSESATYHFFEDTVQKTVSEIRVLESMKGNSYIVSVEDYKVVEHTDRIGWDIFIRMELLTPFVDYISERKLTEEDVIRLGIDICSALELCAQENIIHRDIKPDNIFYSIHGSFKIGDFGIARELAKTGGALTVAGTKHFMAPEVDSKHYDATVDIYSLGIVLYKLLNNNRLPFLDANAQMITPQDYYDALERRMGGEQLPDSVEASPGMSAVLKAACAFDPRSRFQTPSAFKTALESVSTGKGVAAPMPERRNSVNTPPVVETQSPQKSDKPKRKAVSKPKIILCLVLVIVIVVGGFIGVKWIQKLSDPAIDVLAKFDAGDYDGAISLFNEEMSGKSNTVLEDGLKAHLQAIPTDFQDRSIDYKDANAKIDAIARFGILTIRDPLNEARDLVASINASRSAYETAEAFFRDGNFPEAIVQYRLIRDDDENYEKAQEGIQRSIDAYRESILASAEVFAGQKDYVQALATLDAAVKVLEDDKELAQRKTLYQTKLVSEAISGADELASQSKYAEAIAVLDAALQVLPNDLELTAKLSMVNEAKPVSLADLVVVDSIDYKAATGQFTDSFGNTYHGSLDFNPSHRYENYITEAYKESNSTASYAVYNTGGQYKMFSADIVAPSGLSSTAFFLIEVYLDDNADPAWVSEDYTVRTGAVRLDLDITNAGKMKIDVWVKNENRDSEDQHYLISLVDAVLSK